jgi:hypothetical protein
MSTLSINSIIENENITEVLELRQWLQDAITRIEHEHTQLIQLLKALDMIAQKPQPRETQTPIERQLNHAKLCFAPNLRNQLDFTHDESTIRIRPRQYLDRTVWQAITTIITQLNGHWQPAGTDSHWTIPQQKPR